jgi:hypothetical protein
MYLITHFGLFGPDMNDVFFVLIAGRLCSVTQFVQVAYRSRVQCVSFIVSLRILAVRGYPGECRLSCARKMLC